MSQLPVTNKTHANKHLVLMLGSTYLFLMVCVFSVIFRLCIFTGEEMTLGVQSMEAPPADDIVVSDTR